LFALALAPRTWLLGLGLLFALHLGLLLLAFTLALRLALALLALAPRTWLLGLGLLFAFHLGLLLLALTLALCLALALLALALALRARFSTTTARALHALRSGKHRPDQQRCGCGRDRQVAFHSTNSSRRLARAADHRP
jgi:hypothetical protein